MADVRHRVRPIAAIVTANHAVREQDMAFVIDLHVSATAIQTTTQQKAPTNNASGAKKSEIFRKHCVGGLLGPPTLWSRRHRPA
ncbi:hypothetical protein ACK6D9_07300 [Hoeflea sp. Naph1]|uniref:hypothetical protein n=1 Tax=Hoeflea sp. Naph1 TaxID=3388653 RepID=UPI00398FBB86